MRNVNIASGLKVLLSAIKAWHYVVHLYINYIVVSHVKVEQDTRNDVVFDVKTSVFRSMAVNGCNSK